MNEQDSFFEMAEQQILFYLYDHKDRTVSKAELRENIGSIGAKAHLRVDSPLVEGQEVHRGR